MNSVILITMALLLLPHTDTHDTVVKQSGAGSIEIEVSSGLQPLPTGSVAAFLAEADCAFLGRATAMSAHFLVGDSDRVYSRLTFEPTEPLRGDCMTERSIDVWDVGGTYVADGSTRKPVKASRFASKVSVGSLYFVATVHMDVVPARGLNMLANRGALVKLDGETPVSVGGAIAWVNTITATARQQLSMFGLSSTDSDAQAFLLALRHAAEK
jgi:hypothetical protein